MNTSILVPSISLGLTILVAGCAVGERTVSLEPDQPAKTGSPPIAAADLKGTINIASITDNRVFQNKPKDPSIPSIDGDVADLTSEQQVRMIGRQRGGFGQALGDTALPEGDSVIKRSRSLLERGFAVEGYQASDDSGATVVADVAIDQFWGWVTPGMWSIKVEANVAYTITLKIGQETKTFSVKGYGIKGSSTAVTSKTWEIVYDLAFDDLLEKLESGLKAIGL